MPPQSTANASTRHRHEDKSDYQILKEGGYRHFHDFMLSYGLKPYEPADVEEAKTILDHFRYYDESCDAGYLTKNEGTYDDYEEIGNRQSGGAGFAAEKADLYQYFEGSGEGYGYFEEDLPYFEGDHSYFNRDWDEPVFEHYQESLDYEEPYDEGPYEDGDSYYGDGEYSDESGCGDSYDDSYDDSYEDSYEEW